MALLAAAAALVCRQLVLQLTGDRDVCLAAWLAATGPPLFFYSFHLYTEAPSAPPPLARWRSCSERPALRAPPSPRFCAATLPWLHLKMIPAAAALGLVALLRLRGRPRVAFLLWREPPRPRSGSTTGSVFALVASPLALYGGVPRTPRVLSWPVARGSVRSTAPSACCRSRPCSCWRWPGCLAMLRRREAWPTRSWDWPCWRRSCPGGCGGGGQWPARAFPGADAAVPGRRAGAAAGAGPHGARALVARPVPDGRACSRRGRGRARRPAAAQPRQPPHAPVGSRCPTACRSETICRA